MNGITRVVLPIGVNAVQSVNCYVLADGDRVTVVDCGVWRPDLPDGGLAALTAGLNGAGYALGDVGRIVVTHAHIDHYGLAGKVMEETGAQLVDARDDRPGLREVPPPRHGPRAAPRHLRGPRGVRGRADGPRRPPHPLAALPALGGGGLHPVARGRAPRDRRRRLGRHAHARPLAGPRLPALAARGACCSPAITCCPASPRPSRSSAASTPTRCAATSTRCAASPTCARRTCCPATGTRSTTRPGGSRPSTAPSCGGWRRCARPSRRSRRRWWSWPTGSSPRPILAHQRQLAINETLSHIAYLRWSGEVERRTRPDGVYEWYLTGSH